MGLSPIFKSDLFVSSVPDGLMQSGRFAFIEHARCIFRLLCQTSDFSFPAFLVNDQQTNKHCKSTGLTIRFSWL